MNKLNILSLILVFIQISQYFCADLTFKAIRRRNDLEFDCTYNLNQNNSEDFFQVSIKKDTHPIYYFNKHMKDPAMIPLPGALKLNHKGTGQLIINDVDEDTSGKYDCEVYYNNLDKRLSKDLDIKVENKTTPLVNFTLLPSTVNNGEHMTVSCLSSFTKEQLVELSISKGSDKIISLYSNSTTSEYTINGVKIVKVVHPDAKKPVLILSMKAEKSTGDQYTCSIIYRDSSLSYNTEILSETSKIIVTTTSTSNIVSNNLFLILFLLSLFKILFI